MRGLDWQLLQLPFGAGVNQRMDDRALPAPALAEAIDVQFDEVGGLQTRKPFTALGSSTASGGTISTARKMVANGNELLLFDKDSLYSWNDQLNKWTFRATHLAVDVREEAVCVTPGDQYDCDRAELSGIIYYAWCDTSKVYVAARDKASGSYHLGPTAVGGTGTRPRLVALNSKVLLFWHAGTDASPGSLLALAIDPTVTNPATLSTQLTTPSSTTMLASPNFGAYYDVTRLLTTNTAVFVARRATTTSYTIAQVTEALSVTTTDKARTCDGAIAISSSPTGTTVQIVRGNGTNVQGDRITVALLADADTAQAIGTITAGTVRHIAAAHRSVTNGGYYRCYVFWSEDETSAVASTEYTKTNYVDTNSTIGTSSVLGYCLGVASRAFDYDGSVYVWTSFATESFASGYATAFRAALQNSYFLWRDDATLQAKCAWDRAAGHQSEAYLPGVALTSGTTEFSWCAGERRIVPIGSAGNQSGYADRGPREVVFTFDSNSARRCVRLGETLYVSGAEILQYDGVGLYEAGWHIYPPGFAVTTASGSNLAAGTYTYRVTWRWDNAKGELDRSSSTTHATVTLPGAGGAGGNVPTLRVTRKPATTVAVEVWRTVMDAPADAPFFLTTSKDPASSSSPNQYVTNRITGEVVSPAYIDDFADATLTTKESSSENGGVLEHLGPPGASIIAATDTRIFLAGVAGDPDRIWYSRLRSSGEVASFHDALTVDVPRDGGDITGVAFQNGILIVFRETATYMFPGEGFDNVGLGQNFGPPQILSYDIGCRDTDSIVTTPEGIAFHSSKGKYLLTRGWTMKPIGLPVSDYDSETVVAAHVVPGQHQVRWVTSSRVMVYDYLVDQWAEWSISSGLHAAIWQGTYHYLAAAGPLAEQTTYSGTSYGLDVETAWIKPNDLQGAVAIRKLQVLGEFRSSCHVRTRIAYDYKDEWVDDDYWLAIPSVAGLPLQHETRPSREKVEAIKVRITAAGSATQATLVTSADVPLLPSGNWSATLEAEPLGSQGNGISLSIGVTVDATATDFIDVRDNQYWDAGTGEWSALANNVGIRVISSTGTVLITSVEAAINADSDLLNSSVSVGSNTLNVSGFAGATITLAATASAGAFASPTGESFKLTGLGLEVGIVPRLHKRFPRVNVGI